MFNYSYMVELLSPKRSADDQMEGFLDRFAERYRRIMDAGCGLSIPDNPMGQPRLGALESIDLRGLSVDPAKVVMNLNTFHTKSELDGLLQNAAKANLKIPSRYQRGRRALVVQARSQKHRRQTERGNLH